MSRLAAFALLLALPCLALLADEKSASPPLPKPYSTPSVVKHPKVIGWPGAKTPTAPKGFTVTAFVRDIDNPRWLYVLPNGDVLVAQARTKPKPAKKADAEKSPKEKKQEEGLKKSKTVTGDSPDTITLLRDADGDGVPEAKHTFATRDNGLNQPLGMALVGKTLFVANTDAVLAFPYEKGATAVTGKGTKILDLPAGGYNNHWTRNLLASRDGSKLLISVGSASNVAENGTAEELLRANILEINPDGTGLRVFAGGLRNPVGMDFEPTGGKLWTAVNERDELGDDLVPDYVTSVREGGFYGWPYSYFGTNEDPRRKGERPDLVKKTIVPDVALGSHTASLGLAFSTGNMFPERYRRGMFVGQRGSWNRSAFVGYRVIFIPFKGDKPDGRGEDFLTGFIANDKEVYGRPVGVAVARDGALLVADEPGNVVWRVGYAAEK